MKSSLAFVASAFVLAGAVPTARSQTAGSGYHLTATWKLGGGEGWDYLTVDPAAHRLYVARQNRVQVIDTGSGAVVGEVKGVDGAHGIALVPALGKGFATAGKSGTVVVFDLKTLAAVGEPIRVGKKPDAIVFDAASGHVFACNGDSGDVSVIDPGSGNVLATIAVGGKLEFAVADGKGAVFVNVENKSEVVRIDTQTNNVEKHWPLAPGETPTGLAIDAAGRRLFAGCENNKMIVLDADSGKVVSAIPIGKGVDATGFDAGTKDAFSSNGDGTLTVATQAPDGYRVVENVYTKQGARTMALDPQTHAVYLVAADFEPTPEPSAGQGRSRPRIVPGSVVVLRFERLRFER